MMLCSITLILLFAGETSFVGVRAAFNYSTHNMLLAIAVSLFLGGVFIKGGIIPFHAWLPEAYSEAPAPVSVFLAGIVTKTLGIYALIRIVNSIFGFSDNIGALLMFAGSVSIVLAALGAIAQNDFKRVLAYSSISQMGYIVLALGAATPLGLAAAMFHFFNHSIFKMLLFINSAAVEEQTRTRNLASLGGLAKRMPVTGVTSVIASLSAAGVPPLAGFWSKLLIVIALMVSGHPVHAAIAVLASILTLAYLLSIQNKVFFGPLEATWQQVREAGWGLLVPAVILALITVGVGIFFPVFLDAVVIPVREAFGG
jgi:multicomponent Na+:H+ antiporter subunit D